MKDKFDAGLYFSHLLISKEHFIGKGLTMAIFILVGNWLYNIEMLMIWVSVGKMSSIHSGKRDVGMGSKAQEVGLEVFIIVCNCVIVTG